MLASGYCIEYDYVDPRSLHPTLETTRLQGLYLAGKSSPQIYLAMHHQDTPSSARGIAWCKLRCPRGGFIRAETLVQNDNADKP